MLKCSSNLIRKIEYDKPEALAAIIITDQCKSRLAWFLCKFWLNICNGDMAEWFMLRTSNLMIVYLMGSNPDRASLFSLEQETLHSLLSTGWFQERIRKSVYKLIA
jgi:hypothetical protein